MTAAPPVLGPENSLLRHGLECVAEGSGRYVPLVMVGRSRQASDACLDYLEQARVTGAGTAAGRTSQAASVIRWDGQSLEREFSAALESDAIHRIHQRFLSAGLIIVDRLDRVTKQAVFQLFSALLDHAIEASSQVVVTLEHFPGDVKAFPPSLVSRLSAGLVVAVRFHDQDSRAAVAGPVPSIRRIISTTARHFSLKADCLVGPSRHKNIATARSTAIFLARRLTGKSLVEIGRHFGGRDHTTVLHSVRIIQKRSETDPGFQREVDAISMTLGIVASHDLESAAPGPDAVSSPSKQLARWRRLVPSGVSADSPVGERTAADTPFYRPPAAG